jgi:hypothetical protein
MKEKLNAISGHELDRIILVFLWPCGTNSMT